MKNRDPNFPRHPTRNAFNQFLLEKPNLDWFALSEKERSEYSSKFEDVHKGEMQEYEQRLMHYKPSANYTRNGYEKKKPKDDHNKENEKKR